MAAGKQAIEDRKINARQPHVWTPGPAAPGITGFYRPCSICLRAKLPVSKRQDETRYTYFADNHVIELSSPLE